MKPGLFTNELLAFADPHHTVIYTGLWCIADRRGVLEDRTPRIHMLINPGRALELTEASIDWLEKNHFIARYAAGNLRLIKILMFWKHQNPHKDERPSPLPDYGGNTVAAPGKHGASTVPHRDFDEPAGLIPSSLIPDSGFLIPSPSQPRAAAKRGQAAPFDPESVKGLDAHAWAEWIAYRAKRRPAIRGSSLPKAAAEMVKLGDLQQDAVDHSIANSYQGLIPPKPNGKHESRRADAGLMADARARAKNIGFRDPYANETAASYMTQVKQEENRPRARTLATELANKMRVGK